jgi:hypothetical protein
MESMVYITLVAFGLAVAAEVAFQLAHTCENRQRRKRLPTANSAAKPGHSTRIGLAAR